MQDSEDTVYALNSKTSLLHWLETQKVGIFQNKPGENNTILREKNKSKKKTTTKDTHKNTKPGNLDVQH